MDLKKSGSSLIITGANLFPCAKYGPWMLVCTCKRAGTHLFKVQLKFIMSLPWLNHKTKLFFVIFILNSRKDNNFHVRIFMCIIIVVTIPYFWWFKSNVFKSKVSIFCTVMAYYYSKVSRVMAFLKHQFFLTK